VVQKGGLLETGSWQRQLWLQLPPCKVQQQEARIRGRLPEGRGRVAGLLGGCWVWMSHRRPCPQDQVQLEATGCCHPAAKRMSGWQLQLA
jgi:hypothetical protein